MLLADPLSRVCQPSTGFYDVSIPAKLASLLKHLPGSVRAYKNVRSYFNKDTAAASRLIQSWKSSTTPVSQGKMCSWIPPEHEDKEGQWQSELPNFVIGTPFAETGVKEIRKLIEKDQAFASLGIHKSVARDFKESYV